VFNTIYLDNNATTPLDPRVSSEMISVLQNHFGNAASTVHAQGWYAAELVQIAREKVAGLLGCLPDEVVFTSGATESNNLAIFGTCPLGNLDHATLVSSTIEHRSVLEPLEQLKSRGKNCLLLDVDQQGELDLDECERKLPQKVDFASLMLGNNEIGSIYPIPQLATLLKQRGAVVHCDATQAAGKIPVDMSSLGVDLLSISAHKLYGPKGAGALFVSKRIKNRLQPLLFGGGHEHGLRAGTLNVPAIVGLGKACELAQLQLDEDRQTLAAHCSFLFDTLSAHLGGVTLNGPSISRRLPGNLNLAFEGITSAALLPKLSTAVALSASSACSSGNISHVLLALNLPAERTNNSIRIGVGRLNTKDELIRAAELLVSAVRGARN
jgi:cysteine desulfurase